MVKEASKAKVDHFVLPPGRPTARISKSVGSKSLLGGGGGGRLKNKSELLSHLSSSFVCFAYTVQMEIIEGGGGGGAQTPRFRRC